MFCRVLVPLTIGQPANPDCLQGGFSSHLKVLLIRTLRYPSLTMQVCILLGYLSVGDVVNHARVSSCRCMLVFSVTPSIGLANKTQNTVTSFTDLGKYNFHKILASSIHYGTRCQLRCHTCIPQWRVMVLQPCTLKSCIRFVNIYLVIKVWKQLSFLIWGLFFPCLKKVSQWNATSNLIFCVSGIFY